MHLHTEIYFNIAIIDSKNHLQIKLLVSELKLICIADIKKRRNNTF